MKRLLSLGCLSLASLGVACGDGVSPAKDEPVALSELGAAAQAVEEPSSADLHASEDDPAARAVASEAVAWTSSPARKSRLVELKILGFNDFHGQLTEGRLVGGRPVGGAAVLASYLRAATSGFEGRSLIIHAGDHVGASPPESALLQDEPSIQFLNTLANANCRGPASDDKGCNIVGTLGNHEFDEGKDELLRLIHGGDHANGPFLQSPYHGARFPYVNANVTIAKGRNRKPFIKPYVIRKLDGVKLGVIGAVLKETPTIVTPSGVAGLTFGDEVTAINEQVAELKCRGVRTILVTIHQGAPQSPSYAGATDPGAAVGSPISNIVSRLDDEVDLVISGHSHSFTNALVNTTTGHPVLVTQAFSASTGYADIDLQVERASGDVVAKSARIVTTYSDAAPGNVRDSEVQALVDAAKSLTAPLVNQVVATFTSDLTRAQSPAGESALGDLIADAQRAAMGTDFAFMNPGGIRADLIFAATASNQADANGLALWGELFAVQPFGNSLVRLDMTGQQIYDVLNQQFAVNRFLQVSGLTYTWDNALPVSSRVIEVRKDGVAIDKTAVYTVTANNFIAGGGDGFTVFTSGTGNVGGPLDLDALVTYLKAQPQPVSASPLNRITRLN